MVRMPIHITHIIFLQRMKCVAWKKYTSLSQKCSKKILKVSGFLHFVGSLENMGDKKWQ